ncbi:uroporphyrinogen decarboxylase family protein [Methanolacinia paynteri]|uniref:uroporphyrinogen decarboxylase family protein n=1 Tax=Methanolacinia paynteri TaxID=230356 RepID=UPI00064F9E25|nr:uroporphyrinogen decarboxylase family protein [Methanolacinia paynteri]
MEPAELYRQRLDRLEAVIKGKEPDRVPITAMVTIFQGHYAGYKAKDVILDAAKNKDATLKMAADFDFDSITALTGLEGTIMSMTFLKSAPELIPAARFLQAQYHPILKDVYTKWPGIELEDDAHPQFIGKEIMKVEEYDQFIENPTEYLNRVALPRICTGLAEPGSPESNAAFSKYGAQLAAFGASQGDLIGSLAAMGYPTFPTAWSYSPLDVLGDFLRDIKNIVIDLFRYPDKVKQAVEALTPMLIESARITGTVPPEMKKALGTDIVECFFPLHLNEYLNPKQYDEFYWPALKKVLEETIAMRQTPYILFEGRHDAHLETLLELPKGKVIAVFDKTDPRKVRDVVGDHVILSSGPPNSLLIGGTPQKVDDYMKSMLTDCKEGGMMIYPGVDGGISGDARPENVQAMIKAVKKYGTY